MKNRLLHIFPNSFERAESPITYTRKVQAYIFEMAVCFSSFSFYLSKTGDSLFVKGNYFWKAVANRSQTARTIVFIHGMEGVNRIIIDEAAGRVCNPTISPRHRGDKLYLTT